MDVKLYWEAIAKKVGDNRKWEQLHPQHQMMVVQSVNMLLQVINQKGTEDASFINNPV